MDSVAGCARTVRITGAILALIIGAAFLHRAWWFHKNFDAIVRIPFVFGCLLIGLFIAGAGIRLLLTGIDNAR